MRDKILMVLLAISCGGDYKNDGDACEGVSGSCLSLRVTGTGTIDSLGVVVTTQNKTTKMGDSLGCPLPCSYRIRPPAGVAASSITAMSFLAKRGDKTSENKAVFLWKDGTHIYHEIRPTF